MPHLTLNRVFAASLIGLLAGLASLFYIVFSGLENTLLSSARQARDKNAAIIANSITEYLDQAPAAADNFESLVRVGITRPDKPVSLRNGLLAVLMENSDISEATFTYAKSSGFDKEGDAIVDPATVFQVSLFRARIQPGFVHRLTWYHDGHFLSSRSHIFLDGSESPGQPPVPAPNPASEFTFSVPAAKEHQGEALWTDLHWSGVDDDLLPQRQRRIAVSSLKAEYAGGQFTGVLRIGLFKEAIDKAFEMPPSIDTATHSIFLCDSSGRLIALSGSANVIVSGNDLRVSPIHPPPQILAALQMPSLQSVDDAPGAVTDQFVTSGTTYLCTFQSLPGTQAWLVGVVVPRNAYLADLLRIRAHVAWGALALAAVIAVLGALVLHGVSVAHSIILREAARMNDFVLEPSQNSCRFHDIDRVLSSLERAKTAMRSMGKYVPMDLVRRLYHRGEEPALGGETTELTILFTDIQGFTPFAESTDPDIVATRLGAYLEVMVSTIQSRKGTIDKFIGDSVMAFWNAPEPVPGHAALACSAAIAARDALQRLYASPAWEGLSGFETRFGLHYCTASVGHFGSPERFNYTAIGDGINLASRLQSLGAYYGVCIIITDTLRGLAGPGFVTRRLDRVAVKGKTESLDIYELISESAEPFAPSTPATVCAATYEKALDAWMEGDFQAALILAESLPEDPPSQFLAARCRHFLRNPPASWNGTYVFESK